MFVKVIDGVATEYSIRQLRLDNPLVSFPSGLMERPELLAQFEVFPVVRSETPYVNPQLEGLGDVIFYKDGEDWIMSRQVIPHSTEVAWVRIREHRDSLLLSSDWTQLPDSPLDEAAKTTWAAYRQALRDVTEAVTPQQVVWPDAP